MTIRDYDHLYFISGAASKTLSIARGRKSERLWVGMTTDRSGFVIDNLISKDKSQKIDDTDSREHDLS